MSLPISRPGGIVFDFDGTIADTRDSIVGTFEETFRRMGLPSPGPTRITATIGVPLHLAFQHVAGMDEDESRRAVEVYREIFRSREISSVRLFDGIDGVIHRLSARGYPLAIASSRSHHSLGRLVEHLGMTECFPVVAGREDAEREKPYPDLLLHVAERMGLAPSSIVMVGDTTYDIEMGNAAGAMTCAVTYGNHPREALEAVSPTIVVDTAPEILRVIGED